MSDLPGAHEARFLLDQIERVEKTATKPLPADLCKTDIIPTIDRLRCIGWLRQGEAEISQEISEAIASGRIARRLARAQVTVRACLDLLREIGGA